jgi:hypothetical protein
MYTHQSVQPTPKVDLHQHNVLRDELSVSNSEVYTGEIPLNKVELPNQQQIYQMLTSNNITLSNVYKDYSSMLNATPFNGKKKQWNESWSFTIST